jgi:hypothetical protein
MEELIRYHLPPRQLPIGKLIKFQKRVHATPTPLYFLLKINTDILLDLRLSILKQQTQLF